MNDYIERKQFNEFSITDPFFTTLREDYDGFDSWFIKKSNETAFVVQNDGELKAFMYVKSEKEPIELTDEANLNSVERIKFGTFKINSTGTILGDRFLAFMLRKIVTFNNIEECYVTVFDKHVKTIHLFERFGFEKKGHNSRGEWVLVKNLHKVYVDDYKNFPKITVSQGKIHQLAFFPKFHDMLFPESQPVNSEVNIADGAPSNTVTKTYLTKIPGASAIQQGDVLVVYRTKPNGALSANFGSVATAVGKVISVRNINDFSSYSEFVEFVGKGTVFSEHELQSFWNNKSYPYLIKFIYNFSFKKRPILRDIRDIGATPDISYTGDPYWGHAVYTNEQFLKLLFKGEVNESFIIN